MRVTNTKRAKILTARRSAALGHLVLTVVLILKSDLETRTADEVRLDLGPKKLGPGTLGERTAD